MRLADDPGALTAGQEDGFLVAGGEAGFLHLERGG